MQPKISVLMSVYNGERFLREALESILGQSFGDFEFVVVNDGSRDATAAMLDACRDPRLRVFHIENRGLPAALNYGLEHCRADLVMRMDADDVAYPHRFAALLEDWEAAGRPEVFGSGADYISEEGRSLWGVDMPLDDAAIRAELLAPAGRLSIMHPTVLLVKDAVLACGGYDPTFKNGQDYDLWLRMTSHSRFGNSPRRLLKYRFQPGSDTALSIRKTPGEMNYGNWMRLLSQQKKLLIDAGNEQLWHRHRDRIVSELKQRSDISSIVAESVVSRLLTDAKILLHCGRRGEGALRLAALTLRHPCIVWKRATGGEMSDLSQNLLDLSQIQTLLSPRCT
jgi:glycosyltransferase involved in cell wall biosynthesis